MHTHVTETEFLQGVSPFLGCFYLLVALMNLGAAYYWWMQRGRAGSGGGTGSTAGRPAAQAILWLCVAVFFSLLVPLAWSGDPAWMSRVSFPAAFRSFLDRIMGPTLFMVGSTVVLGLLYVGRSFFTRPAVAWGGLNLALLCMGLSLADPDFAAIVSKPDNVPIVGLVFLLGFFTWLSARKAVLNDRRLSRGQGPLEGGRQRAGAGLARSGLHRVDLHGGANRPVAGLVHRTSGTAGSGSQYRAALPIRPKRRGTSWGCRRCFFTTIPGWRVSSCPV